MFILGLWEYVFVCRKNICIFRDGISCVFIIILRNLKKKKAIKISQQKYYHKKEILY